MIYKNLVTILTKWSQKNELISYAKVGFHLWTSIELEELSKTGILAKVVKSIYEDPFTNHRHGEKIARQFRLYVIFPIAKSWKGKDGTYKAVEGVFCESRLIFPLPKTRTFFLFATDTCERLGKDLKLCKFVTLFAM